MKAKAYHFDGDTEEQVKKQPFLGAGEGRVHIALQPPLPLMGPRNIKVVSVCLVCKVMYSAPSLIGYVGYSSGKAGEPRLPPNGHGRPARKCVVAVSAVSMG